MSREQVRRDAKIDAERLAKLSRLKAQAERERDEAWQQCDNFERIAREQAENKQALWVWRNENEPRLASVPALVEALRQARHDFTDVGKDGWDSTRWERANAARLRLDAALTVYEQSQGNTE